jgi:hypothetical protein
MLEYEGAANNAEALAKFTFKVKALLDDPSEEMTQDRKLETLQQLLSGPEVLPFAYAAQNGTEV